MRITHYDWGVTLELPQGGEIEIHKDDDGELSCVTLNGKGGSAVSRDLHFCEDGTITADGHAI